MRPENWVGCGRRQFRRGQLAGQGMEPGNVNAFAAGAGIGADIDQHGFVGRRRFRGHGGSINKPAGQRQPGKANAGQRLHGARKHDPPPFSTPKRGKVRRRASPDGQPRPAVNPGAQVFGAPVAARTETRARHPSPLPSAPTSQISAPEETPAGGWPTPRPDRNRRPPPGLSC